MKSSTIDAELEKAYDILDQVNNNLDTINRKLADFPRSSRTLAGRINKTTEHRTRVLDSASQKLSSIALRMHAKNAQMQLPLQL